MLPELTDEERATYEWQIWVNDFGEEGQRKLKNATALVSRCGGLGGPLALELAAAGFGRIIIAHGGNLKPSDLNRQITMHYDGLGKPRAVQAAERLRAHNPRCEVVPVEENINEENAARLVGEADIVFDCAPLFNERFLMNRECVRQNKPLVECAMFDLEGQVTAIIPGQTPCLRCIYPEDPPAWKRQFPVFGAVSGTAGCIGAMEGIKIIAGMGTSLAGEMLYYDLRRMAFHKVPLTRDPACPVCSTAGSA